MLQQQMKRDREIEGLWKGQMWQLRMLQQRMSCDWKVENGCRSVKCCVIVMWKRQKCVDLEYPEHAAYVLVLEDGDNTSKGREECGRKYITREAQLKNVVIAQSGAQGLIFTQLFVRAKKIVCELERKYCT